MTTRKPLSPAELEHALADLPDWSVVGGKLHKQYKFRSFARAIGWMMSAAIIIDNLNHHPEWSNVYNRVTVDLVTHDAGGTITHLDVELARRLDAL
jgi:4a-hydroxytetrahydrobiopterin dehydratase